MEIHNFLKFFCTHARPLLEHIRPSEAYAPSPADLSATYTNFFWIEITSQISEVSVVRQICEVASTWGGKRLWEGAYASERGV